MAMLIRLLPLVAAFGLVALSGLLHGLGTARWHPAHELEEALTRLERVPRDLAGWKGEDLADDAEKYTRTGARGYVVRRYTQGDRAVTMILMYGPAGPLSVHTPQDCYPGAGYQVGTVGPLTIPSDDPDRPASFWTARIDKPGAVAEGALRLYWSWNAGTGWQAPASARWTFRGCKYLYKLYVIRELAEDEAPATDPAQEFLRQLVPTLDRAFADAPSE
jgi:hypothetical protein